MDQLNTYPKTCEDVMGALPQSKAHLMQNVIQDLPPTSQVILNCTLAHMADTQFETLIHRFTNSEPGRLRHYIYILGAYCKSKSPPRKTSEQKHSDQPARAGPNVVSAEALRHGLEKLPKELRQATEAMLIESTLYPDFIFPDQAPGPNGRHFFLGNYYEPPKYEILLALNRENYAWHGPQFWDNFFVVGKGEEGCSLRWLQRMDKDARCKIRKIYISLDSRDLTGEELTSDAQRRSWICYQRGAIYDPISMLEEFDEECDAVAERLCAIWHFKLEALKGLRLESLVVDVRDARGLDGACLARAFMGMVPSFGGNRPRSVRVLAVDEGVAGEMLEGFR